MPINNEPFKKDPTESLIERTLAYFEKGRSLTLAQKTVAEQVKKGIDSELTRLYAEAEKLSLAPKAEKSFTLFGNTKKAAISESAPELEKAFAI